MPLLHRFHGKRQSVVPFGALVTLSARLRLRIGLACVVALGGLSFTASAHAASYQVPSSIAGDCSVDVTQPLLSWIASVPDNSTLSFASAGCYRIEGVLEMRGRNGLHFEGNGATFRSFNPPEDQRAIWRAIDSTGFAFHNMTIDGSYASGGTHDASLQHAHAIDLRGTSADIANVAMSDVAGDCVYFGLGFTSALTRSSGTLHDSTCSRIGRNAVSVTAGDNILVQRVTTSAIGYIAFDVEPNVGSGWGSRRVTFDSNTIGNYTISAYSLVENAPVSDQAFTNNHVVGRGLKVTIGQTSSVLFRPQNVTITGNAADAAQAPSAMNLHAIDGLTVTGNTVPIAGGTMAAVDDSCSVAVTGNTYPGGSAEAAISPFQCSTPTPTPTPTPQPAAPTVAITSPSNGALVSGAKASISAAASSTAVKTEVWIDGALKATASGTSINWTWNIRHVAKGAHAITAKAYDAANQSSSSSITVYR
jgi:hypothetical protein